MTTAFHALYAAGIPLHAAQRDVVDYFESGGSTVKRCAMLKNDSDVFRGAVYVVFKDREAMTRAQGKAMAVAILDGRMHSVVMKECLVTKGPLLEQNISWDRDLTDNHDDGNHRHINKIDRELTRATTTYVRPSTLPKAQAFQPYK